MISNNSYIRNEAFNNLAESDLPQRKLWRKFQKEPWGDATTINDH